MSDSEPVKTVPINLCDPGDVLAKDVHNKKGQKVVSADTKLTEKLIKRLVGSGVRRVELYGEKQVATETKTEETVEEETAGPETRQENGRLVIDEDLEENYVGEGDVTLEGDLDDGAVLTARGDIEVLGEIRDGTVRAMQGEIDIQGTIETRGDTVQLISNRPIKVSTVVDSRLSVNGHLMVTGRVKDANIECLGNLIVHDDNRRANIMNSSIEVEGRVMADKVTSSQSDGSEFSFRDPDVVAMNRKRKKTESKLEDLRQEAEKLKNLVDTVSELGDQVKDLPSEKKKKIKERTEKYKSVQNRIEGATQDLSEIEDRLEEIKDERRYFMRVLNTLQNGTSIQYEEASTNVDNDEENVRLYKKGMIVIQDASDIPFQLSDWLEN